MMAENKPRGTNVGSPADGRWRAEANDVVPDGS